MLEGDHCDHAVVGLIHLAHQKNRKSKAPRPLLREARDILLEVPEGERIGHVIQWRGSPVQKIRRIWNTILLKTLMGSAYSKKRRFSR